MKTTRLAAVFSSEQEMDGSFFLSLYLCMHVIYLSVYFVAFLVCAVCILKIFSLGTWHIRRPNVAQRQISSWRQGGFNKYRFPPLGTLGHTIEPSWSAGWRTKMLEWKIHANTEQHWIAVLLSICLASLTRKRFRMQVFFIQAGSNCTSYVYIPKVIITI